MISAMVLAAGASRRMGCPKPMVKWGDRTMLQSVVMNLKASRVDEVVVVLGHRAEEILPTLRGLGCRVVVNRDYARGMSSSIRRGLSALDPGAQAVLIALGDQPSIPAQVCDRLLKSFQPGGRGIVVPTCGGRRGHPVLFSRDYWAKLAALEGDVGGREILHLNAEDLLEVEVTDDRILLDIDRPKDASSTTE